MKKLLLISFSLFFFFSFSLFFFFSFSFSYTQPQVTSAINQVMSRYDENTQLLKLNAVIPKIGRMQLANPPKEIRDLLKQIEFAVRERINTVLASQVVLEVSPLSVLEQEMFDEMNNYRARRGLSPLVVNQKLNQAAQILADDMAKQGYFDHVSPQGIGFVQRLNLVGYEFSYVSENLGVGGNDALLIVDLWSKSPVHEKNLFSTKAKEVGVAYETVKQNRVAVYASPK